jgi:hypothetical protein
MKSPRNHQTHETLVDQIRALLKLNDYQSEFQKLIKRIEDRLRRKLRLNELLLRKSRKYGTYVIEDYHGGVKDRSGMTLAQVVAFTNSTRAACTRHTLKQEIASVMYGKLQEAQITGSSSNIVVKAHSSDHMIFLEAQLRSCPDLRDSFTMDVFGKHENEFIVEESDVAKAGKQATVMHDRLGRGATIIDRRSDIIRACKIAKAKGDQIVLPECEGFTFDATNLQWLIRRECQSCLAYAGGVVIANIRGNHGTYALYLRGRVRNERRIDRAA